MENIRDYENGKLTIVSVSPDQISFGRQVIICVAGVISKFETEKTSLYPVIATLTAELGAKNDAAEKARHGREGLVKSGGDTTAADADVAIAEKEVSETQAKLEQTIEANKEAVAKANPVELWLYLDGVKAPTAMKLKARRMSDPQPLKLNFERADSGDADIHKFWQDVLAGGTKDYDKPVASTDQFAQLFGVRYAYKPVEVGLSVSDASMPEATQPGELQLKLHERWAFWGGLLSFGLIAMSLCLFARGSTLLRDNQLMGPPPHLAAPLEAARSRKAEADAASQAAEQALAPLQQARTTAEQLRKQADDDHRGKVDDLKRAEDAVTEKQSGSEAAKAALANGTGTQLAVDLSEQELREAQSAVSQKRTDCETAATTLEETTKDQLAAESALNDLRIAFADAKTAADDARTEFDRAANAAKAEPEIPIGSYSLARTQMAFWLALTTAGFLFLWLTIGRTNGLMTTNILALLGITAATALGAVLINPEKDAKRTSKNFLRDMFEKDGPQLYRIQAVLWTVILGMIFAWNVYSNFKFVEFGSELLALTGFANLFYLGFKIQEGKS